MVPYIKHWSIALVVMLLSVDGNWGDTQSDEDFAFDLTGDEDLVVEVTTGVDGSATPQDIQIPDATAVVGRIFQFTIPSELFPSDVDYYEIKSANSFPLPNWLLFDKRSGIFHGVPLSTDVGTVLLTVKAPQIADIIGGIKFTINVLQTDNRPSVGGTEKDCQTQSRTVLTIITDTSISDIKPKNRLLALNNLARFLGVPVSAFKLAGPSKGIVDESSIILAGPGDRKSISKQQCAIQVRIGCRGQIDSKFSTMIQQIKEQARDGTLTEVSGLPVLGWRVSGEGSNSRPKRQLADGADKDASYYDENNDDVSDEDEYDDIVTEPTNSAAPISPTASVVSSTSEIPPEHPHRHHHGELPPPDSNFPVPEIVPIIESFDVITTPTPTPLTIRPTTIKYVGEITPDLVETKTEKSLLETNKHPLDTKQNDTTDKEPERKIDPIPPLGEDEEYDTDDDDYDDIDPTESPPVATSTEKLEKAPVVTEPLIDATIVTVPSSSITEPPVSSKTTSEDTVPQTAATITTTNTTESQTTSIKPSVVSTLPPTTTVLETEETVESTTILPTTQEETTIATVPRTIPPPVTISNSPPTITHRLQKLALTAGKAFRFLIPNDTFTDHDGDHLYISFLDGKGAPIKRASWIQYNPRTRELYGLPLDDHVSKWEYIVRATDTKGADVSDTLETVVQHHKGRRTVAHEFTLKLRVEDKFDFPSAVDWQLRVLEALKEVYNVYTNETAQIIVLNVTTDPVTFTWTDDILPRNHCPKNEIEKLMRILTVNDETPSDFLQDKLSPEIRVKQVSYRGVGQCESKLTPAPPPPNEVNNSAPTIRNQIDQIIAIEGELLAFTVPQDTFYDNEDKTDVKLSLFTMNRHPLAPDHWLQFDVNNRQFYGIPQNKDIGVLEYQLIGEDRWGLTATDSLIVKVHRSLTLLKQPSVEFSMIIDMSYDSLMESAATKRRLVQKLAKLFNDTDTSAIVVASISSNPTTVTWVNKTLPTDKCPNSEINKLRRVLLNNEEISEKIPNVMQPFEVSGVGIRPAGVCLGGSTIVHPSDTVHSHDTDTDNIDAPDIIHSYSPKNKPIPRPIPGNSRESTAGEDYLIVYVLPGVIILVMLFLAGVVACVLYRRRRRSGKLNVGDDERRSLRTKGIPVIFQDELEDKPEPGNKTPIIMKEEKPPLPPPEYSKRGESPEEEALYQPPPPFPANRDSGRGVRPKATPTYRKPPPYVPP